MTQLRNQTFRKQPDGSYATIVTNEKDANLLVKAIELLGADARTTPIIGGDVEGFKVIVPSNDISMVRAAGYEVKEEFESSAWKFEANKSTAKMVIDSKTGGRDPSLY